MWFSNVFGTMFVYQYRSIGLSVKISDAVLGWAGSISALV